MYSIVYGVITSSVIKNTIHPGEMELAAKKDWFTRLEKSILEEGIRNPVVLTSNNGLLTPRYGGSRIMIAQRHNLSIPVIIADIDKRFQQLKTIGCVFEVPSGELILAGDISKYFVNKPAKIIPKPYGLNVSGCADGF